MIYAMDSAYKKRDLHEGALSANLSCIDIDVSMCMCTHASLRSMEVSNSIAFSMD